MKRVLVGLSLAGLLALGCVAAGVHARERGGDPFWGTGDDPVLSRCYSLEQPGVNCDSMTDAQRRNYVDNDGDMTEAKSASKSDDRDDDNQDDE